MSLIQEIKIPTSPFMISGSDLVACVVYEAIRCKTWPTLPRKADIIVSKVSKVYYKEFERLADDFYYKEFKSYKELSSWLEDYILPIPEIQELNLSNIEFENGITIDDENREKYVFRNAYSPPCPANEDFIDLDAYVNNLTHDLIRNKIETSFRYLDKAKEIDDEK